MTVAVFLLAPPHSSFVASAPAIVRAQEKSAKIRIGLVPLISSGPIFIAEARKFFEKINLDAELKYFADGALAMPALVAGELDVTATTLECRVVQYGLQRRPIQAHP